MFSEKRANILKVTISVSIFIIGTISNIFLTAYMHLLLSGSLKTIKFISIFDSINIIMSDKKANILFLSFELAILLLAILYYMFNDRFYQSKLTEITPDIKIPVSAGQMQFGSARFMTEQEQKEMFKVLEINKKDKRIKDLLNIDYDNLEKEEKTEEQVFRKRLGKEDEKKIEKNLEKEKEKGEEEYKFNINIDIESIQDCPEKMELEKLFKIIKEKAKEELIKKEELIRKDIEKLPDDEDKIRYVDFQKNNKREPYQLEEEIDNLQEGKEKKVLRNLYKKAVEDFNILDNNRYKSIKEEIDNISEISHDSNLNKIKDQIDKVEKKLSNLQEGTKKKSLEGLLEVIKEELEKEKAKRKELIEEKLFNLKGGNEDE